MWVKTAGMVNFNHTSRLEIMSNHIWQAAFCGASFLSFAAILFQGIFRMFFRSPSQKNLIKIPYAMLALGRSEQIHASWLIIGLSYFGAIYIVLDIPLYLPFDSL